MIQDDQVKQQLIQDDQVKQQLIQDYQVKQYLIQYDQVGKTISDTCFNIRFVIVMTNFTKR